MITIISLCVLTVFASSWGTRSIREGLDECPLSVVQTSAANEKAIESLTQSMKTIQASLKDISPHAVRQQLDAMQKKIDAVEADMLNDKGVPADGKECPECAADALLDVK